MSSGGIQGAIRQSQSLFPSLPFPTLELQVTSGYPPAQGHGCSERLPPGCLLSTCSARGAAGSPPIAQGRLCHQPRCSLAAREDAALTHLHVLWGEAGEGLQGVIQLVPLLPFPGLLVVVGALALQPQVADELLHLPEGTCATLVRPPGRRALGAGGWLSRPLRILSPELTCLR